MSGLGLKRKVEIQREYYSTKSFADDWPRRKYDQAIGSLSASNDQTNPWTGMIRLNAKTGCGYG
jgi:hypothetical protein